LKNREKRKQKEIELFKGKGVFCPLCQSEFKSFAPWFGSKVIENARCPQCESMERHRLLWLYLHERTDIFDGGHKRLLHFAPQRFLYNHFFKLPGIEYFPCDNEPDKYEKNYQGQLFKADIGNLPFENNFFDVIICSHILEHVNDDIKAISELKRVLKNEGWCIVQVPIDLSRKNTWEDFSITKPEERVKAFGQEDHVRIYGKDFKERLMNAGFHVNEDHFAETFSVDEVVKYGIDRDEMIYSCTK